MFCPNCGTENNNDGIFCSSCGTRLNAQQDEAPQQEQPVPPVQFEQAEVAPEPPVQFEQPEPQPEPQPAPQPEPEPAPQQVQPQYQQPPYQQPQYQQPQNVIPPNLKPLSPWAYFGLQLLFGVPIVGFIFAIIFSLDDSNLNRRSFARSYWCSLILVGVILVIYIILAVVFAATLFSSSSSAFYSGY